MSDFPTTIFFQAAYNEIVLKFQAFHTTPSQFGT